MEWTRRAECRDIAAKAVSAVDVTATAAPGTVSLRGLSVEGARVRIAPGLAGGALDCDPFKNAQPARSVEPDQLNHEHWIELQQLGKADSHGGLLALGGRAMAAGNATYLRLLPGRHGRCSQ